MTRKAAAFYSSVAAGAALGFVAVARRNARGASPTRTAMLPSATFSDTVRLLLGVVVSTLAKGVILRRPRVVSIAERLDLDARGVRVLQQLRGKYQAGPILVGPVAGRRWAVVLRPEHVRRVLAETPEPFATAAGEERAALVHFEPKGVLISHGADRADRRRFNEDVLDYGRPVHRIGDMLAAVVRDEALRLVADASADGELTWDRFAASWFRAVRRVVLGEGARDDHELSRLMARLRSHANWEWLWPKQPALRRRLFERLDAHLARAEPRSLAGVIAAVAATSRTAPTQQVPQWLFAFDAAGMATFRALALLATHPEHAQRARQEIGISPRALQRLELPYLRACVLESLRLWPTTPLVLRESTEPTSWESGVMPPRTVVAIYAPFFHRDDHRVPFAHRFTPDVWLEGGAEDWGFVPFSLGSAACPGRDLVLLLASTMLATVIDGRDVRLASPHRLAPQGPLPGTLNPYSLRFRLSAHAADRTS